MGGGKEIERGSVVLLAFSWFNNCFANCLLQIKSSYLLLKHFSIIKKITLYKNFINISLIDSYEKIHDKT